MTSARRTYERIAHTMYHEREILTRGGGGCAPVALSPFPVPHRGDPPPGPRDRAPDGRGRVGVTK